MRRMATLAFLMAAFVMAAKGQVKQGDIMTSATLNAQTSSVRIVIRNLSNTNNYWYLGTGSSPELGEDNVFIWEPAGNNTFYLRRENLDESGAYIQNTTPITLGNKDGAQTFITTNPTTSGTGSSYFNNDKDKTSDDAEHYVRLVNSNGSPWLNVQNGDNGSPTYNTGYGAWTIHHVYLVKEPTVSTPTIFLDVSASSISINCSTTGATLYYTTDGTEPSTTNGTVYAGPLDVASGATVKAVAVKEGYKDSEVASFQVPVITAVSTQEQLEAMTDGHYVLQNDIALSGFSSIAGFTGTFDGGYHTLSGLSEPLFTSLDGAIVKNVVLDDVAVYGGTDAGAIAATATGDSRIYNCGVIDAEGTVSGSGYVGGLVGALYGNARVINCYNFADVSGGTWAAGVVGYNDVASTSSNLQTLVMNCFFYGDITAGTNTAPVYGGKKVTNQYTDANSTGINNYNYFRAAANIHATGNLNINPTAYNCALAAEELYLKRFEFYRYILNANRELCAYYVTGDVNHTTEIGKWVLDERLAPYPVVKTWGKYPSVVNPDYAAASATPLPYQGKKLGELTVTVAGAGTLTLPITDMDTLRNDYNYYKVQLPYYKDCFTDDAIVTGWKITAVTGNTNNTFGASNYNFADRNDVGKDLYGTSGRVFAQGGFYNVPEGVTAITIEPYRATNVAYLADATYDVTMSGTTKHAAAPYMDGRTGTFHTDIDAAISALPSGGTVYDNAIVLVGNYHSINDTWTTGTDRPFTLMSIDRDGDNEPDYGVYHFHSERKTINSVKFDFLNHCPVGMAHKETDTNPMLNIGIFHPKGWFEVTETCFPIYTEFEYNGDNTTTALILNNGIYRQFVSSTYEGSTYLNSLPYMILGGRLYFDRLSPGCHPGASSVTKHSPISILGGEFKEAYLSGIPSNCTTDPNDNPAYLYSNGGKMDFLAGAYMQPINGNVTYRLDHSYIREFYGGSVSEVNPITGNIDVEINHSLVGRFCGGPQFGDMTEGKSITTKATGTVFGEFYGAGYGGTSLTYKMVATTQGSGASFDDGNFTEYDDYWSSYYANVDADEENNILVGYRTDFFFFAGGNALVHRFNQIWASFSLAKTYNVSSTLTDCTVNTNFYGGGCKGYVAGNTESVLDGCTVKGNAFAAGYTSAQTSVNLYSRTEAPVVAYYNHATGLFTDTDYPEPVAYNWVYDTANAGTYDTVDGENVIYTNQSFDNLGRVAGNATITVTGDSRVAGAVYGGGDETDVEGTSTVQVSTGTAQPIHEVYGGANRANVKTATVVDITSGRIGNVFGGNNMSGYIGADASTQNGPITVTVSHPAVADDATPEEKAAALAKTQIDNVHGGGNLAPHANSPVVNIQGGTVENVFGGGLGEAGDDVKALVTGNPTVNISGGLLGTVFGGGSNGNIQGNTHVEITNGTIRGNVYGGGFQGDVSGHTNVQVGAAP